MSEDFMLEILKNDVRKADRNFQEAKGKSVNLAIYELMCAEERLSSFIKHKKKNEEDDEL